MAPWPRRGQGLLEVARRRGSPGNDHRTPSRPSQEGRGGRGATDRLPGPGSQVSPPWGGAGDPGEWPGADCRREGEGRRPGRRLEPLLRVTLPPAKPAHRRSAHATAVLRRPLVHDAHCGPCTLFARTFRGLSRHRLEIHPLDGPESNEALSDLEREHRFAYAHLVLPDGRRSGADILAPLMEGVLGSPGRRLSKDFPPARWLLRRLYGAFWEHRRAQGCAAVPPR